MAEENKKTALIIGAGPAGLTAALELLRQSDIRPIIFEASDTVGGISRTVNFNGYRMDLGGHRFFSKSDWVMNWWQQILPMEASAEPAKERIISYRNASRAIPETEAILAQPPDPNDVMLLRNRLSRIYFMRELYDYPIKLNLRTITNLGLVRCMKAGTSYIWASMFPRRPELNLEDFLVNRFGGELYRTFFESYTEKVWGVPCANISPEWGAQRIKGLSLAAALLNALRRLLPTTSQRARQNVPVSLIERFLYPRLGPGHLWEKTAKLVRELGGEVRMAHCVDRIEVSNGKVTSVTARDLTTGATTTVKADWVISTMAVKDLVASFDPAAPSEVSAIAHALPYRSFITVGVIVKRMKAASGRAINSPNNMLPDNWIYIQEPDVKLGRLQIFNNWSPALVPDPDKVWLGLEYFCDEDDELWRLSDAEMQALAVRELVQIDLVDAQDVEAATVIRVPKAYPAYFGAYADFGKIRSHVDGIKNLFLVGRNGMHRYNNQDHSMLTAKAAVENIVSGRLDKDNIWDINVDDEYSEMSAPST